MVPFAQALKELNLQDVISIVSVPSGYPSPKLINQVLRRLGGRTFLFESSAATPEIVETIQARLTEHNVDRLDALLVTHCHGDHAGSAGITAGFGRADDDRAPIYLHSAGYRYLTQPDATFLNETYEIFLSRSHWGLKQYNTLGDEGIVTSALRKRYAGYFSRTPKSALRFVDYGQMPDGILAVPTPGHSSDCVLYYDAAIGVAVPGDTIICKGHPDKPESMEFVIPIFTVLGQAYSLAYERYLQTIRRLRRFFETHAVRVVLPPHGRFAVTDPHAWVTFAERYFKDIYRAFIEDFLGDRDKGWRDRPFMACDLNPYIPSAGAHPISTPSHSFGMLCMLADEGFLSMAEDPHTRNITFHVEKEPPQQYVARLLAEDPGPVPVYRSGYRLS